MSAKEYLKRVGLIQSPQISQERVIKHMESYAREYHAKEMQRKSEGIRMLSDNQKLFMIEQWILNHLKEKNG